MHIIIAGALPPAAYAAALAAELPGQAPHLTALLAQARAAITPFNPLRAGCTAYESLYLQQLGYRPTPGLPFGAGLGPVHAAAAMGQSLAAFAQAQPVEAVWLGTFAHVALGTDQAVLLPVDQVDLNSHEMADLVAALAPLWEDSGFRAYPLAIGLLRLTLPPGLTPATASVQAVAGQPLQAWWQTDISSRPWRRLLNEIQMVWHDHPVNQARQEQGQPTVNALWLYGGAQPWTPAPSTDSAWQDDSLLACAQQGDWHAWLAAVARLDRTMFAPLVDPQRRPTGPLTLTLLGERRVARLDLVARPTWLRWLPSSQIDWKHWWSLPA